MTRRRTRLPEQGQSVDRRSGVRPGRRFALPATVALALLAYCPSVAVAGYDASEQVSATVYASSGTSFMDSTTLGTLESSDCPTYGGPGIEEYEADGSQGPPTEINYGAAWSLGTLLGCLPQPIPLGSVHAVIVEGPNGPEAGGNSQLTPSDLASPSDFANPSESPVIFDDGSGITYERPWRGSQYNDANAEDQFTPSYPSPFTFEVFEGPHLGVTITPSANTVRAGATVSFTATVTGAGGSPLSYSWSFDGAAPSSTASAPTLTPAAAGTYRVTLQVTDANGGGGGDATQLTVNGQQQPATGKGPDTGPQNGKGTKPAARASGTSRTAGRLGKDRSGKAGSTRTGISKDRSSSSTTTTSTTPATTGRPAGAAHPSPPSAPHHISAHRGPPPAAPAEVHQLPLIEGSLISDVTPLPLGVSPLVQGLADRAATAPAERRAARASLPLDVASGLVVLMLLSLGAGRELRGSRDWRALRFGG